MVGPVEHRLLSWWQEALPDILQMPGFDLGRAIRDAGIVFYQYLIQQMMNPAVQDQVKRKIALAMAPKMALELRAHGRGPGRAKPGEVTPQSEVSELLQDYNLKVQ